MSGRNPLSHLLKVFGECLEILCQSRGKIDDSSTSEAVGRGGSRRASPTSASDGPPAGHPSPAEGHAREHSGGVQTEDAAAVRAKREPSDDSQAAAARLQGALQGRTERRAAPQQAPRSTECRSESRRAEA